MMNIRPVSDLRNKYPEIEEIVKKNREPVFLTKNGYGSMVVMSLEQYSALTDGVELALDEADRAAADTETRYSAEEVFERVRSRNSIRQKFTAT
ncbi:MAG: type II toxin-antitoxin system Phd/YefM family antitoxin [Oscillospiraceae bacterium]|nr:type II toxin-antitoxin system Phd/YefM family antitoxin [Oscillospiraceae bacterium]